MRRVILGIGVLSLAAGCAAGPRVTTSKEAENNQLQVRTTNRVVFATVAGGPEEGTMTGPDVRVKWTDGAFVGTACGQAVSLAWGGRKKDRIDGFYAGGPVQLHLAEEGDTVAARGLFGGQQSNLRIGPERIEGNIGRCSYDLKERDGAYEGFSSCRGLPQRTSVELPRVVAELPPENLVAAVSSLLAHP